MAACSAPLQYFKGNQCSILGSHCAPLQSGWTRHRCSILDAKWSTAVFWAAPPLFPPLLPLRWGMTSPWGRDRNNAAKMLQLGSKGGGFAKWLWWSTCHALRESMFKSFNIISEFFSHNKPCWRVFCWCVSESWQSFSSSWRWMTNEWKTNIGASCPLALAVVLQHISNKEWYRIGLHWRPFNLPRNPLVV